MPQESFEIKIYPLADKKFIGTIKVDENLEAQDASLVETVILLDRSYSMGESAKRVANEIIPLFLSKLHYSETQVIHFITFDSKTELYSKQIKELKSLRITARDGTVLATAIEKCQQLFGTFSKGKPIRVLTISDGEVSDIEEAQTAATKLVEFLKLHDFSISSQAVRLFTSSNQPDTTALASLLQINNTSTPRLIDISTFETNNSIAEKIAVLFRYDNLAHGRTLNSTEAIFIKLPWESTASSQLTLAPGDNLFWLKSFPSDEMKVGESSVNVITQQPLTLEKFQKLMRKKVNKITEHMKILKIVGTDEAEETVAQMVEYFKKTEEELMVKSESPEAQQKKITEVLDIIASDDFVKDFDAAQKADYLRQETEDGDDTVGLFIDLSDHEEEEEVQELMQPEEKMNDNVPVLDESIINALLMKTMSRQRLMEPIEEEFEEIKSELPSFVQQMNQLKLRWDSEEDLKKKKFLLAFAIPLLALIVFKMSRR